MSISKLFVQVTEVMDNLTPAFFTVSVLSQYFIASGGRAKKSEMSSQELYSAQECKNCHTVIQITNVKVMEEKVVKEISGCIH